MKKTPGGGHIGSLAEQSIPDWLQPYIKAYPKVKAFIVTSDRMVFLPRQSGEAADHQKALNGKNGAKPAAVQVYQYKEVEEINAPGGSPVRPAHSRKNIK